jgi:peroxiredoxin
MLLALAAILPADSVSGEEAAQSEESPRASASVQTLEDRLDSRAAKFAETAPAEMIALFEAGLDSVRESGVVGGAVNVGDTVPAFSLPGVDGKPVDIGNLLDRGPVVLTFYRGGWCPYCNMQLRAYQDVLPEIERLGAELVAVSPQVPDSSIATAMRDSLEFYVLSDVGNRVASELGIVYTLPSALCDVYQKRLNLSAYNADTSCQLPLAATWVIDRDGVIRWAFLDADYRKRAEPADIVRALRALQK